MKIAVVGPSPVPYVYGGVEGLLWKLVESINKNTAHQAELIKLPVKERSFWELIESYYNFYKLDLTHFDLIISTKYPSWMVKHDNHIVYMVHHLRGLFDTYSFCNEPLSVTENLKVGQVKAILELLEYNEKTEEDIDNVFEMLRQIRIEQDKYDKSTFRFPGPFIREIIHFFDGYALSPTRVKSYFSISENLKRRQHYFPPGVKVKAVYPPAKMEDFLCNDYCYLFTASRLDAPKRIDILIDSMKYVPHNIQFKIAGTGPEEKRLKELAKGDKRIEFLGFVNDEKLIDLYSNALAVLFIPYDEDYGLITIEAMRSRKPVITANDSGGPLEFVINSETGYFVDVSPQQIAERINFFIEHPEEAKKMGSNAYENVKNITWQNVTSSLLGEGGISPKNKKKVLVLSTYSCYPPRGGGQHRLFNIYSLLAKKFDVTIYSIIEVNKTCQNLLLENGLKQICVPQSKDHAESQWKAERALGLNLYDVCMVDFIEKSSEYVQKAKELMRESDIIIFSHPYLYELHKLASDEKKIIYEAHNVEYTLKKDYINDKEYADKVREIELNLCSRSNMIFSTSGEDKKALIDLYNVDSEKVIIAPNGVNTSEISFIKNEIKSEQKAIAGIPNYRTVLFVGSWHPPNLGALKFIVDTLAKEFGNYLFLVVGSVKDYYLQTHRGFPKNVLAFGVIDEKEKYDIYKLADIAINPMFTGSGTNIKMLDYMSAGIPVISTPVGARGLEIENYKHAIICSIDQMAEKISELIGDQKLQNHLRTNARSLVETNYSWEKIAKTMGDRLLVVSTTLP